MLTFIKEHYRAIAILTVVALLVITWTCYTGNNKKIEELKQTIDQEKGRVEEIERQAKEVTNEVIVIQKKREDAVNEFVNSNSLDSSVFTGNAEDRFCTRFPNDSTCAGRKRATPSQNPRRP